MSRRRKARELALQALYAWDITEEPMEEVFRKLEDRHAADEGQAAPTWIPAGEGRAAEKKHFKLDEASRAFSRKLADLVEKNCGAIDGMIQKYSENWDLGRVACLDKNILRMAIAEMLYIEEIPKKVSIDEAIELAKKYSTENSGKFINGILDPIAFDKPKKEKTDG